MRDERQAVLRELLRRKTETAGEDVVRNGGQVSADEVDGLGRLARLVEVYDAAHPPPAPRRWPLAAALGVTLLVVSLLLFVRVPETEIELDVMLSEVGFTLAARQVLTGGTTVSALGVSGLREVRLPVAGAARGDDADGEEASAVRLAADSAGARTGTVNLATLALPEGTRVRVRGTAAEDQYALSLQLPHGSTVELRADVNGPVLVARAGGPAERVHFASPKGVLLVPAADEVELDLTFGDETATPFAGQLSASDLSLHRVDEFVDASRTLVRHVSTVRSGTLYREALNGEERRLRPGEGFRFTRSRGEIRTLELRGGEIAVRYHGHVRGMTTGSGESRRSLMPTWLEWLRARHGLSLLWGTALYLFGLVVGALRWWRADR